MIETDRHRYWNDVFFFFQILYVLRGELRNVIVLQLSGCDSWEEKRKEKRKMAGDRPSRRGSRIVYREVRFSLCFLKYWASRPQAPDSDEEFEIEEDTKVILLDKQVCWTIFWSLLENKITRTLEKTTATTQTTHLVAMVAWMTILPRGYNLYHHHQLSCISC